MDRITVPMTNIDREIENWESFLKLTTIKDKARANAEGVLKAYKAMRGYCIEITDKEIELQSHIVADNSHDNSGQTQEAFLACWEYIKSRINQQQ